MTDATIVLPDPQPPVVMRVISDPLFPPDTGKKNEPVMWALADDHPFVAKMRIVRMFQDSFGVYVYSVSHDGRNCVRHFIPADRVRLVEEMMPIDVFVDELARSEANEDEEDDEEEEGDEEETPLAQSVPVRRVAPVQSAQLKTVQPEPVQTTLPEVPLEATDGASSGQSSSS